MSHNFVKSLKEGEIIESAYLVREKSFNTTRNGAPYISMELADKTGIVKANKWDAAKSLFDSFNIDDFVKVKARVELFRKFPQLKLDSLEKVDEKTLDFALYLPTVDKDIEGMFKMFLSELGKIRNDHLKQLLNNIFLNPELQDKFKTAPSATDFHHPYIGGLLEHSLSCVELSKILASRYSDVDMDLLIAGAALHDIGKIEELSYKRSFYYTDKGRLMGHIILGVNLISKEIDKIKDFPEESRNLLLHIILSHHGEYEWGSPKRPMCLEAIIFHYIDNLDAKINGFGCFVKSYNAPDSKWTKHSKMFREFLYKGSKTSYKEKNQADV